MSRSIYFEYCSQGILCISAKSIFSICKHPARYQTIISHLWKCAVYTICLLTTTHGIVSLCDAKERYTSDVGKRGCTRSRCQHASVSCSNHYAEEPIQPVELLYASSSLIRVSREQPTIPYRRYHRLLLMTANNDRVNPYTGFGFGLQGVTTVSRLSPLIQWSDTEFEMRLRLWQIFNNRSGSDIRIRNPFCVPLSWDIILEAADIVMFIELKIGMAQVVNDGNSTSAFSHQAISHRGTAAFTSNSTWDYMPCTLSRDQNTGYLLLRDKMPATFLEFCRRQQWFRTESLISGIS